MAKKKPAHGGARPGAGRPRRYAGGLIKFGVSMPGSAVTVLDELATAKAEKIGRIVSWSEILVDLLEKVGAMKEAVREGRA